MSEISALDALATTRSIHRYRPDPIPDEDLSKILWSATRAPSGTNRQPFRFLVLRDGERARQAKALLGVSFRKNWSVKKRVVENRSLFCRRDRERWITSGIAAAASPIRKNGERKVNIRC